MPSTKRSLLFLIVGLPLAAVVLAACQTDRQRLGIGDAEVFEPPVGLFGAEVTHRDVRQSDAAGQVIYYFQSHPEMMEGDVAVTLKTIALFEWLSNDMLDRYEIPAYKIRRLIDARNEIRRAVGIPEDMPTSQAVAQLHSMSRVMARASDVRRDEPDDIRQRRQLLVRLKAATWTLFKESAKARQQAAKGGAS